MPDWIRRTALADILVTDFSTLTDEARYRNLDRLHPQRAAIERALAARERTLFNLDDTIYLYDLTSTYFEARCPYNSQAQRGYSRDHRPDCKQVVVGLVVDREGFRRAHEVFDGTRQDRTTLDENARGARAADPTARWRHGRGRSWDGLRGQSCADSRARPSLHRGRTTTGAARASGGL
jgi:hypothetical protein